jgi:hypothetical protein
MAAAAREALLATLPVSAATLLAHATPPADARACLELVQAAGGAEAPLAVLAMWALHQPTPAQPNLVALRTAHVRLGSVFSVSHSKLAKAMLQARARAAALRSRRTTNLTRVLNPCGVTRRSWQRRTTRASRARARPSARTASASWTR